MMVSNRNLLFQRLFSGAMLVSGRVTLNALPEKLGKASPANLRKEGSTLMAKGKMGERVSEDAQLKLTDVVVDCGYKAFRAGKFWLK